VATSSALPSVDSGAQRSDGLAWRGLVASLRTASALLATASIGLFFWCASKRVAYPFELDWMEGCMLDHVERLREGLGIYVRPSLDFVPYMYNPLFYVAGDLATHVVGMSLMALRLVSIVSTATIFGLLATIVWLETRSPWAATLAAAAYAGTYPVTSSWLDVGRVDSLAIALCLGAILAARTARSPRGLLVTALLVVLAFATRQNTLTLVPALGAFFWLRLGARRAAWFAAPAVLAIVTGVAALTLATHGWYWFYAFRLPFLHPRLALGEALAQFLKNELVAPERGAVVLAVYLFLSPFRSGRDASRAYLALGGGALTVTTLVGRFHSGAFVNDDLPLYAALALWFGVGLHRAATDGARLAGARGEALACAAALLQMIGAVYDPHPWVPTTKDLAEGERLLGEISVYPGEVLVADHSRIVRRVGKRGFAHDMALFDIMRMTKDPWGVVGPLQAELEEALRTERFDAILLDGQWAFQKPTEEHYHLAPAEFVHDGSALVTKTSSMKTRWLFLPN
jgi:hypothetical protein